MHYLSQSFHCCNRTFTGFNLHFRIASPESTSPHPNGEIVTGHELGKPDLYSKTELRVTAGSRER